MSAGGGGDLQQAMSEVARNLVAGFQGDHSAVKALSNLVRHEPRLMRVVLELITRGDEAEKERNFDERLLAAIFLKNESGSMWARADPSDKEELRRFLICSVESELSMEIGNNIALAVAEVALAEAYEGLGGSEEERSEDNGTGEWRLLTIVMERLHALEEESMSMHLQAQGGFEAGEQDSLPLKRALDKAILLLRAVRSAVAYLSRDSAAAADEARERDFVARSYVPARKYGAGGPADVTSSSKEGVLSVLPSLHPGARSSHHHLSPRRLAYLHEHVLPLVLQTLASRWCACVEMMGGAWHEVISGAAANVEYYFNELSAICLQSAKILRDLFLARIGHEAASNKAILAEHASLLALPAGVELLKRLPAQMNTLCEIYASMTSSENDSVGEAAESIGKQVLTLGKMILGMIRDGENQLLPYLAPFLRFYLSFLQHTAGRWADNPHEEGTFQYKLAVQSMSVVADCLDVPHAGFCKVGESVLSEMFPGGLQVWMTELLSMLVRSFLLFRDSNAEEWDEDPMEQIYEDLTSDYRHTVLGAAEFMLLSIVRNSGDDAGQVVYNLLTKVLGPELQHRQEGGAPSDDPKSVAIRDACYRMLQCSFSQLYPSHLNFNEFFETFMLPDLQLSSPWSKVLKRRIAMVLSDNWRTTLSDSSLEHCLQAMVAFVCMNGMGPMGNYSNDDVVVAVWSAIAIRNLLDPFFRGRSKGALRPVLEVAMVGLANLAQELSGSTCTVYVVEVISVMLEEMGSEITNAGQSIVQVLGRLWEDSGDHALVRIALLRCLTSLVNCVGGKGLEQIGDACLHVVGISTNPKLDPDFVFIADGMEVWLSMMLVLESAFPEGLVELAQANLPLLLQADVSSHVPPALLLHIAQCYLVCCPLFNTDTPERKGMIVAVVSVIRKVLHTEGVKPSWRAKAIKMFSFLLVMDRNFFQRHFDDFAYMLTPMFTGKVEAVVAPHLAAMVARLYLTNPSAFVESIVSHSQSGLTASNVLWAMSEFWKDNLDEILDDVVYARLVVAALAHAIADEQFQSDASVPETFVAMIRELLVQAARACSGHTSGTNMYAKYGPLEEADDDDVEGSENDPLLVRREHKRLWERDIVNEMNVAHFVGECARRIQSRMSERQSEFEHAVTTHIQETERLFTSRTARGDV